MNEREFRRRNQQREEERVLKDMRSDAAAAKEMEQQLGVGIPNLSRLGDPVPAPTLEERLSEPVKIPVADNIASLDDKRRQKQEEAGPETVGDGGFVCADLGYPPPGTPTPTHVKIGDTVFLAIPHEAFDQAVDLAFKRGYQRCLTVYGPVHKLCNVPPRIDPIQLRYCEMVMQGMFND